MMASSLWNPTSWLSFSNSTTRVCGCGPHVHRTLFRRGLAGFLQGTGENVQPLFHPLTPTFCVSPSLVYSLPVDLHPIPLEHPVKTFSVSSTHGRRICCPPTQTLSLQLDSAVRDALSLTLCSLICESASTLFSVPSPGPRHYSISLG